MGSIMMYPYIANCNKEKIFVDLIRVLQFNPFNNIRPCILLKMQNLARIWPRELSQTKKGLCIW